MLRIFNARPCEDDAMHILLTGGTGLIGRALCRHWAQQGHQLTVWSRTPQQVEALCGRGVRGIARLEELAEEPLDAVVNLAGAPIADRPWTRKRKALLWASRITLTEELGIRVVLLRTGLVLARDGGFLKRLLLPFKLGLGGPLGSGRQWMPWIHISDQIALIDFLLQQEQARGPYNACAPQPVRNREFSQALGRELHRPAFMPAPAFALRLALGELSELLLGGQRALPTRLQAEGFSFRFTHLDVALADLLGQPD